MIVREIGKKDEQIFLRLCNEFYSAGATKRGYDEALARLTYEQVTGKHENLWGYILEDNGSNLGYALITSYWCNEDGGNVIILDELYIRPSDRNRGYAKEFMQWMEQQYSDIAVSITLEVLSTNVAAKNLYAVEGYEEDGFEVLTKPVKKYL
ncbi:MAG: GNAT family N-acetyltransferase [Clostridia bacterium]